MKKAFDSVSHQSILVAAAGLGIPLPFLGYLRELYGDAWTRLRIGTELSELIKLGRGVRQGDPMSVHLFNAVIDLSLAGLGMDPGEQDGGQLLQTSDQALSYPVWQNPWTTHIAGDLGQVVSLELRVVDSSKLCN